MSCSEIYSDLEILQTDLDEHINQCDNVRIRQVTRCQGKTPTQTFYCGKKYYAEKNLNDMTAAKKSCIQFREKLATVNSSVVQEK